MMNQEKAQNIWFNYIGNKYVYVEGDREGNVTKPKKWTIEGDEMMIHLTDGVKIAHSKFSDFLAVTGASDSSISDMAGLGETPAPVEDNSGSSDGQSRPTVGVDGGLMSEEEEKAENERIRKNKEQSEKRMKDKEKNKKKDVAPVVMVLENVKDVEKDGLKINYELDMVSKDSFNLLSKSFQDNTEKHILEYYLDSISLEKIRESLEESLKAHMIEKYGLEPDVFEEPDPEDEIIEGKIVNGDDDGDEEKEDKEDKDNSGKKSEVG